ncbi:MAG: alpha/beta hydrolase [Methanomicrobiales archaeon]|nr:alpha/beta hydrolase [Methanomicrobiales archaeon]
MPALLLIGCILVSGCASTPAPEKSSFSVDESGILSLSCAPVTVTEEPIFSNGTYTKSRIILHTENGDVVTYLAAPPEPKAVIVYAPGAGETLVGHEERMVRFASAGYAFLFVDTRGNGGETPGLPFGQQMIRQDYEKFSKGTMPQYYLSICDLVSSKELLDSRFHVPAYAMGSSNGGRYAAVAAGVDPGFAGYIGISTSDWGLYNAMIREGVSEDPVQFAASIEPGTYLKKISPRPVWIFHAEKDPVIPFDDGKQFFENAQEPRQFVVFSGDHGINPDVDQKIIGQWAQIYASRG